MSQDIIIRPAEEADADAILAIYAPYVENTAITFEHEVPAPEEFRRRMRGILGTYPYLVCTVGGAVQGYAYAARQKERAAYGWNAELSVYLSPALTGRGAGKALYRALMEILRLQGVVTVYGGVTLPNPASEGLHESMGFAEAGVHRRTGYKDGRWLDVRLYEKGIGEYAVPPAPVVPVWALAPAQVQAILERCNEMVR